MFVDTKAPMLDFDQATLEAVVACAMIGEPAAARRHAQPHPGCLPSPLAAAGKSKFGRRLLEVRQALGGKTGRGGTSSST